MPPTPLWSTSDIPKNDWDKIRIDVANQMAEYTKKYITSVSLETSPTEGRLIGSGIYMQLRGHPYILTNEHVAKERLKGSIVHTLKNSEHPYCITNPFQRLPSPVDMAIARIEKDIFIKGERVAISADKIKGKFDTSKDELIFVQGFLGIKSHMLSTLDEGLFSRSLAYLSQVKSLPHGFDSKIYFAVDYPWNKSLLTKENKRDYLPEPDGMSGSGVWDTGYVSKQGSSWSPEDSCIVGLICGWHHDSHTLIGIKIEIIRQFLILALRKEAAYFRWLERGKPNCDDWNDWFVATNSVTDIFGDEKI